MQPLALPPLLPPRHRRRRRWLSVLGVFGAVVVLLVLGAKPLARAVIDAEARAAGVVLSYDALALGWGTVTLSSVTARLDGVNGLEVRVDRVEVDVAAASPARVRLGTVSVVAQASVVDLLVDLARWSGAHGTPFDVPLSSPSVHLDLREPGAALPFFALEGGTLTAYAHAVVLRATRAAVGGVAIPHPLLGWSFAGSSVALGVGAESPAEAPLHLDIEGPEGARRAKLTLRDTSLAELAVPLGLPKAATHARIEGQIEGALPTRDAPLRGTLRATVRNLALGFPREVDALLASEAMTVTSALELSPDHTRAHLTDVVVTAGALRLGGAIDVTRGAAFALARGHLRGVLPCAAVARSAATADLGRVLGGLAGGIAGLAVGGEIAVDVQIDADTRDPARPLLRPTIGVGCGLRFLGSVASSPTKGEPGER